MLIWFYTTSVSHQDWTPADPVWESKNLTWQIADTFYGTSRKLWALLRCDYKPQRVTNIQVLSQLPQNRRGWKCPPSERGFMYTRDAVLNSSVIGLLFHAWMHDPSSLARVGRPRKLMLMKSRKHVSHRKLAVTEGVPWNSRHSVLKYLFER